MSAMASIGCLIRNRVWQSEVIYEMFIDFFYGIAIVILALSPHMQGVKSRGLKMSLSRVPLEASHKRTLIYVLYEKLITSSL